MTTASSATAWCAAKATYAPPVMTIFVLAAVGTSLTELANGTSMDRRGRGDDDGELWNVVVRGEGDVRAAGDDDLLPRRRRCVDHRARRRQLDRVGDGVDAPRSRDVGYPHDLAVRSGNGESGMRRRGTQAA